MEMLQLKVCGMRDGTNIRAVEEVLAAACPEQARRGLLWMGFIFYEKSPRLLTESPACFPQKMQRVGVFVDAGLDDIVARVNLYGLQAVQLHGHESPAFCAEVRSAAGSAAGREVKVFKAFSLAVPDDLQQTLAYEGLCDLYVFDTKTKAYGGSGHRFDWSILRAYRGRTPFLLSGGIGPDCVDELRQFSHPLLAGYDLNSRFEIAPGVKDPRLLDAFVRAVCAGQSENKLKE